MKTSIKIILLLAAILVCVAAVLVFQKTMVQPPLEIKTSNQYEASLKDRIKKFNNSPKDSLEYYYFDFLDYSKFMYEENKVDENIYITNVKDFIDAYSPKFTEWCYLIFTHPVWKSDDLKFIGDRIQELKNFNINGNPVTSGNDKVEFNKINGILDQYHDASVLAQSTSYTGLESTRTKINRAREYAQEDYLSNNTALVAALNALPRKIEQSHYRSILAQVNRLQNYRTMTKGEFENLADKVKNEIDIYKKNARNLYGTASNVDHLEELASNYYNEGYYYFQYKEEQERYYF